MEFHHRRLLLLNEDVPVATTTNSLLPPPPSMFLRSSSLQLTPRTIFTSNLAYAFLFLFTAIFFLGFILLYIRHFSRDFDSSGGSLRRRNSSSSAVKPLPELPYREDSKTQQAECAICLDEFREGITVKMIPYCKHVFHPVCIDTWLVEHVTCPVCRCEKIVCESRGRVEAREEEGEGREVGFEFEGTVGESREVRDSSSNSNRGSRFGFRRSMSF